MEFVAFMPFLIPIVAILVGGYVKVSQIKAEASAELGRATAGLQERLDQHEAERDRLQRRIEALEAIVTAEGYDLERDARRAMEGKPLLSLDDLGAAPEAAAPEGSSAPRGRVRG